MEVKEYANMESIRIVVETVEVQSIVLTTSRNHVAMNVEGKDYVNITIIKSFV